MVDERVQFAPEGGLTGPMGGGRQHHFPGGALHAAKQDLVCRNKDLSQQNKDIRTLLESAAIPMLSLDTDLRIRAFTPEIVSLFNLVEADRGRSAREIAHRLDACDPLGDATAVLQNGLALAREVHLPETGQVFLMRIRPTGPAGGVVDGVVLSFVDISEQKRAEEKISHAGKLMALGEIASCTAHELNQPLNTIRIGLANITAKLRRGELAPDDMAARLERVERNVERAITVVSHILAFGRPVQAPPACFDASLAVLDACLLAQQELQDAGITLKTTGMEPGAPVRGHASLLEQVVLNLLFNARDAILSRRKGEPAVQGCIEMGLKATATALQLRVQDNGVGIGADIASRVFEPFFTTKEIGKGTGLGLSISARIIGEMGGRISVEAVPEGSCFRIDLPSATVAAGSA